MDGGRPYALSSPFRQPSDESHGHGGFTGVLLRRSDENRLPAV